MRTQNPHQRVRLTIRRMPNHTGRAVTCKAKETFPKYQGAKQKINYGARHLHRFQNLFRQPLYFGNFWEGFRLHNVGVVADKPDVPNLANSWITFHSKKVFRNLGLEKEYFQIPIALFNMPKTLRFFKYWYKLVITLPIPPYMPIHGQYQRQDTGNFYKFCELCI